ncbi:MAG: endonuclease MutS2 [Patescibacteria group bacterium]
MVHDTTVLEFTKILAILRQYAETDRGKRTVLSLPVTDDVREVERMLSETDQARRMIERYDATPLDGVLDVGDAIKRARLGSTLAIEELLDVVSGIDAVGNAQRYIRKVRQLEIPSDALDPYYDALVLLTGLKTAIEECIDVKGQIYDDASEGLAAVRTKIAQNHKKIDEKMQSLLHSEAAKLTDSIITIRNGRLVLPVRAEYKNSFKGIIHDQSASMGTVFIEPMGCVELNNLSAELALKEAEEIERILSRLSAMVGVDAEVLSANYDLMTTLDVVFAKAKYAVALSAVRPELTKGTIQLVNARHPLIPKETVVANTIGFGSYRSIVITGPNTGGKTVALKTLGLLSLMVQAGMLIPADEFSKTIVFRNICADIGDEQSIEQSLSTFSSHITKIIAIIDHLADDSLVLLDELGVGTDPKEGASLAIAILDHLRNKRVYSMVTTHYPELKLYAMNQDDTVNASVEFDVETLRPTYRLQIGIPGTSNALDIAKRLGLAPAIVAHAGEISLSFDDETAHLMKKLERQSLALNEEIDAYKAKKLAAERRLEDVEAELAKTKNDREAARAALEREKERIVGEAKEEATRLIAELDQLKKSASFREHELARLKHDVKALGAQEIDLKKVNQAKIAVGDVVTVIPYQRTGIVMRNTGGSKFEIQMGALSGVFDESQIEFSSRRQPEEKPVNVRVVKSGETKIELDLRGERFEEAMTRLDKFVDDCLMANLEFAYVIHGYGTGALRKGVQDYIRRTKEIKSSRPGGQGEGGSGITVLYFK